MTTDAERFTGRPVKTTDMSAGHDWQADLEERWQALGRRIFVRKPQRPPMLRELIEECAVLAVTWAMVEKKGCLSNAAVLLGCSRHRIRDLVRAWLRANPDLIPMPFKAYLRWSQGTGELQ